MKPVLISTVFTALVLTAFNVFAGSATWKLNPTNGDWNTAANWSPATVPNFSADIATFATSNVTKVSGSAVVDSVVFNPGASAFVLSAIPNGVLAFGGTGAINNSGVPQNFVAKFGPAGNVGEIEFFNSATVVGANTIFTTEAPADSSGGPPAIVFFQNSSAGDGTFVTPPNPISGGNLGGQIFFLDQSTAGNATFTINGGSTSGAAGGLVRFYAVGSGGSPTAGNAILTINGGTASAATGGSLHFESSSNANASTLIANGGQNGGGGGVIQFEKNSRGGKASVVVNGNGTLDISGHSAPGVSVGSLAANGGTVLLGQNNLTVGSNRSSTIFAGHILDSSVFGGPGGGSLTKIGSGTLTLAGTSQYSGGTTIKAGTLLLITGFHAAGLTGPVQVISGTLGGNGSIFAYGDVTIGTGSSSGAKLLPGKSAKKAGTLEIADGTLTFNSLSTYGCILNRTTQKASLADVSFGVTINSNASFSFIDTGTGTLTPGQFFTVIHNHSGPIVGTFSNLPDGATFTSNGTTFKASYTGGDGNALTLTVQ
jgi:autotransporter-associated beta strand protein